MAVTFIQSLTLEKGRVVGVTVGVPAGGSGGGTPDPHAASHQSGGSDAIKLDDLAAPDDNTDLNVSETKHGLTPKLPGGTDKYLRGDGTWATIAGASGTPIMEQIWEAMDANADPVDTLITSGSYRIFIYMGSQNANAWKAATNATYTVPVGKKLVVLQVFASGGAPVDTNRDARLFNSTDAAEVVRVNAGAHSGRFSWQGDAATASKNQEIAAGKTVRLEVWNVNTTKRASGIVVICRELNA